MWPRARPRNLPSSNAFPLSPPRNTKLPDGLAALTEAHGDEVAFALVTDFIKAVETELPAVHGEHVKRIGDALMAPVPDPGDAILLGLRIANDLMIDHGAPAVRVGPHHGPAVESEGDYFGTSVNLAARVSALAPAVSAVSYRD